jgi:hypothetical protein
VECEVEYVDEECDGAEGCLECDCCVRFGVQLPEHVEECLEEFQACISKSDINIEIFNIITYIIDQI